jgi:DNA-binding Xre family transcriptional regulator
MLMARGITKPVAWATKLGFHSKTAVDIVHGRINSLRWLHFETICTSLNCTPNDLFTFKHEHNNLPEGHELLKLQREETIVSIQEQLKDLSTERLAELQAFLKKK